LIYDILPELENDEEIQTIVKYYQGETVNSLH